jgi:hypothetical protein
VERLRVIHAENLIALSVVVDDLIPAREAFDTETDLDAARDLLLRHFGRVVEVYVHPVMSAQRTTHQFAQETTETDYFSSPLLPRKCNDNARGHNTIHYFGPLLQMSNTCRPCGADDIVCGLVVPDKLHCEDHASEESPFALPHEPLFFEQSGCSFQWFNGDHTTAVEGRKKTGVTSGKRQSMTESQVMSALSIAVMRRSREAKRTTGLVDRVPHPQWYQPFCVRLPPHHVGTQHHSTRAGVGSTVTTLQHGLQPLTLVAASDTLDRAILLAVLRRLSTVELPQ